jgi:hypothetical protein
MKTLLQRLLAVALLGASAGLFPCDVTMETSPAVPAGKGKIQVKLFVECVHRRCPVRIDMTKLETAGLTIEKQGQWQVIGTGLYRLDLTVSLTGKGNGEISVLRQCPKHGQQKETLEIKQP